MIKHVTYFSIATFLFPAVTFASDYEQLVSGDIPLVDSQNMDLPGLINALFAVSVGVAAILAVIMLAIGGFRYMTSESVFKMGDAREQISNAIIGLLIVLVSILILYTINPEIVKFNLFK